MKSNTLHINEIFYSLQGEGRRAGTANVFVRFAHCNQTCKIETHGFDCDTEFASARSFTPDELLIAIRETAGACRSVILTGGEPALQVDLGLVDELKAMGFFVAMETNGSVDVSGLGLDWVTVSPKVAEHAIRQLTAHEVKYVRQVGQAIPQTRVKAFHYLLSPATHGDGIDRDALAWCIGLVKDNPVWALSVQQHKQWKVR